MVRRDPGRIYFQSKASSPPFPTQRGAQFFATAFAAGGASQTQRTGQVHAGSGKRAARRDAGHKRAVAEREEIWRISPPAFTVVLTAEESSFGTGTDH